MTDRDPDRSDDPWLTLNEIADELRVNPATVRLWVSKGLLEATRAGKRKLLVRRSELDRVLSAATARPSARGMQSTRGLPRLPDPDPPPPIFRRWSLATAVETKVDPDHLHATQEALREADRQWAAAVAASENAPPDPGFVRRLRALAEASKRESDVLETASAIPTLSWTPQPDARHRMISYELRPGGNRAGQPHLWLLFDGTVKRLGIAMEGNLMGPVADEYRELALILDEIAKALEQQSESATDQRGDG